MVIWYYNHYSGSSTSPKDGRSYYLNKSINKCGHDSVVIAASYHHLQKDKDVKVQKDIIKSKNIDGVPLYGLKRLFM